MKKLKCILLVDDNKDDNQFHRIKIEKANICDRIEIVNNGEEALEFLIRLMQPNQSLVKPDIIFLDVNMPLMNGFEFLEEYKNLDMTIKSKIMIVMLTTSLNPRDLERAMATNEVTEFLNKPLTVEKLQETVKKYF